MSNFPGHNEEITGWPQFGQSDGDYDWICCEDRFLLDGHDSHLIRGWLPLAYFEGYV